MIAAIYANASSGDHSSFPWTPRRLRPHISQNTSARSACSSESDLLPLGEREFFSLPRLVARRLRCVAAGSGLAAVLVGGSGRSRLAAVVAAAGGQSRAGKGVDVFAVGRGEGELALAPHCPSRRRAR